MDFNSLHNYQKKCIDHIVENTHCGLFLDMGLGKTVSTLTAIHKLYFEELDVDSVLVIGPKRVAENVWNSELKKWGHLSGLKIQVISGKEKDRIKAIKTEAQIYTIGRDNVSWLCTQFGGNMLPYDMLVVDESSSFKNSKSVRFKALKMVQPSFKRVVILTGTPVPNGLMDLWPQIYLLDRGERLGKTIEQYREMYFKRGDRNGYVTFNYRILPGSDDKIQNKISDVCISMSSEDYLTLPERIDNYIELDLDPKTKELYEEFEREQVMEIFKDGIESEISVTNAAALVTKLLQFSNGAIYDEDKNYHEIHDLKIQALRDIIESNDGKPILVAYSFRHDLERILKHLKEFNPIQLKGQKEIDDWNKGKISLMVMHPASGGHGLNIQFGGNTIVWFGQNWSLELYQQFNARLHRQGQVNSVMIHHLVTNGTFDEDVIKSLKRKDKVQSSLLNSIKAKVEKYFRK